MLGHLHTSTLTIEDIQGGLRKNMFYIFKRNNSHAFCYNYCPRMLAQNVEHLLHVGKLPQCPPRTQNLVARSSKFPCTCLSNVLGTCGVTKNMRTPFENLISNTPPNFPSFPRMFCQSMTLMPVGFTTWTVSAPQLQSVSVCSLKRSIMAPSPQYCIANISTNEQ